MDYMNSVHKKNIDLRKLINPEKILLPYCDRKNKRDCSPFSVELHLTSYCNHNCYHCSYRNRRSKHLTVNDNEIEILVEDLVKMRVNGIYWSGGGEPTTLKNISKYMKKIADSDIEQALVTNGILLNDKMIAHLVRFNYIAVSFPASKNQTYQKITGCYTRDRLYKNIKKLRSILEKTIIGARCVINKFNYKEIISIYNDAKELGFDYIIFIPVIDYEKRGNTELTKEEKDYLKEEIKTMTPYLDSSFTNLLDIFDRGMLYYKEENKSGDPCYANNIRATAFINYDGGVWLCQPHIGNPEYSIGNINERRFCEIWNSERHKEVIKLLDNEHKKGACKNCRSIGYNKVISKFNLTGNGERFYDAFL